MSRRRFALWLAFALLGLDFATTSPASAQDQATIDAKVNAMIAHAKDVYGVSEQRRNCEAVSEDEIIVCAPDDGERWRVPPTSEADPESRAALRDGVPHAPNVAGRGIFSGPATASNLCIVPPCASPPVYMIDLSTIPEAPEGSDADKIAKGEMRAP